MVPPVIIQDFAQICRCCMEIGSYDMLKTYFENELLSNILKLCTSIQIPTNDNLPKNICQNCLQQLLSAYMFRQKSVKVQDAIVEISKVLDCNSKTRKSLIFNHPTNNPNSEADSLELEPVNIVQEEPVKKNDCLKLELEPEDDDLKLSLQTEQFLKKTWMNNDLRMSCESLGRIDESSISILGAGEQIMLRPCHSGEKSNIIAKALENDSIDIEEDNQLFLQNELILQQPHLNEIEKHQPNKSCSTCFEIFDSYSLLIQHCMQTKHPRPSIYKCHHCFKKMECKSEFLAHLKNHLKINIKGKNENRYIYNGKNNIFTCLICNDTVDTILKLRNHFKEKGDTHLLCSICKKKFPTLAKVRLHERNHFKEKPFSCGECGLRFTMRSNLERHKRLHGGKTFNCDICQKGFTQKMALMYHLRTTHPLETNFLCYTCGKIFATDILLKKHLIKHNLNDCLNKNFPTVPIDCDMCGKTLSCKATLYAHIKNVHEKQGGKFNCVVCGKSLKTKSSLDLHLNYHTGNCPYKCLTCGKAFTNPTTLKSHSLTHSDERPYACKICNKSFKQKPHLNTHMLTIHIRLKPFRCTFCSKTFALNGNLSQHLKTHTGCESPFICEICHKGFYFASRLRKHERIHFKDSI